MKRLNIDIEEAVHTEIKLRAATTGMSMSEVIREMLDEMLENREQTKQAEFALIRANGLVDKGKELDPELDPALKARLLKEQAVKAFNGKELKKCKNGHYIPDGRHKCLEKGCKYS